MFKVCITTSKSNVVTTLHGEKKHMGLIVQRVKIDFLSITGCEASRNAINNTSQPIKPIST